jgi:hypothetical protein
MDDGWVHALAKILPSLVSNLWWKMIGIWMENHFVSDSNCIIIIYHPPESLQGITNNVELTFSVGDTIPWFTIRIEQDN